VSGSAINEGWIPQYGPYVSGTADDRSSDISVIFAPFMPTVSGFAVSGLSQPVSGIGLDCGIAPCGIPTGIGYNQLTWTPNSIAFLDMFDRVAVSGWGTAPGFTSLPWTVPSGDGSPYSVNGSVGLATVPVSTASAPIGLGALSGLDMELLASFTVPSISAVGSPSTVIYTINTTVRDTGSSSRYLLQLNVAANGEASLILFRNNSSVVGLTSLPALTSIPFNGTNWTFRLRAVGGEVRANVWQTANEEPDNWQIVYFDPAPITVPGKVTTSFTTQTAANATVVFQVNSFAVNPVTDIASISYELQRMDEITPWQTIMLSDNPYLWYFNDYEARVGLLTSYRIRRLSTYDFPGLWSSTVTISSAAPGVSGSCLEQAHVMIFTTNERQDGSSNLAYSNAWEDTVTEDFNFPEAGFTQLQPMYNRDFFTAFRPRERGGEVFSRSVLVQAAAIAPETLADFTSLRQMAWDDVSYICVRDEDGNRWFANVSVPTGVVQNRRKLYLATVQIAEVTDVPVPYNPPTGL
jgi:hypothetical protein